MVSRPRPRGGRPRALPRLVAVLAALAAISTIVGSVRAEDPEVTAALGFGGNGGAVDASPVREEYPIATDQTDDAADNDGEEADDGEELRRRLDELERLLYLGGVEHRDAEGALVGMFELASEAPSMEEVIEVTGRGVGGTEWGSASDEVVRGDARAIGVGAPPPKSVHKRPTSSPAKQRFTPGAAELEPQWFEEDVVDTGGVLPPGLAPHGGGDEAVPAPPSRAATPSASTSHQTT